MNTATLRLDRLAVTRRVVLIAHVIGALCCTFPYLSSVDAAHFPLLFALPPLVPYVTSAIYSWRVLGESSVIGWLRVTAFVLVLALGTFLAIYLSLHDPSRWDVAVSYVGALTGAYLWAAEWLIHVV